MRGFKPILAIVMIVLLYMLASAANESVMIEKRYTALSSKDCMQQIDKVEFKETAISSTGANKNNTFIFPVAFVDKQEGNYLGANCNVGVSTKYTKVHTGADWFAYYRGKVADQTAVILAPQAGVVKALTTSGNPGHSMKILTDDGLVIWLMHMSQFAKDYKEGDRIEQGDVIGVYASYGNSTAAHLHYQMNLNDSGTGAGTLINPFTLKSVSTQGIGVTTFDPAVYDTDVKYYFSDTVSQVYLTNTIDNKEVSSPANPSLQMSQVIANNNGYTPVVEMGRDGFNYSGCTCKVCKKK